MSLLDLPIPSITSAPRVIPAQVNFLTIYNPALGVTEDTEGDQIVFWGSKADLVASQERTGRRQHVRNTQKTAATYGGEEGTHGQHDVEQSEDQKSRHEEDEKTNYRLRQIGLARGMVEFVKNFPNDKPVSSIETKKSRIILHELEQGWWILASIDLTHLPAAAKAQTEPQSHTPKGKKENGNKHASRPQAQKHDSEEVEYDYSAREVASPQLLLAQLVSAHRMFLLHHAPTLWDLYNRLGKARFINNLQKFWRGFLLNWDVLLHGNPAVEVYGPCTKLAGGGELGIGVGEEEWGSGEREVLEEFLARTEGCADLVVGRYGDAPRDNRHAAVGANDSNNNEEESHGENNAWLGVGDDPGPADGVVFSGNGNLSRKSLATVSQWMEAIFKHGKDAYGVGENPSARSRQKRRSQRPNTTRKVLDDPKKLTKLQDTTGDQIRESQNEQEQDGHQRVRSPRNKAPDLRRQALENNFLPPGIPAPLVSSVERSLGEAIAKAGARVNSRSPKSSPTREKSQEEVMNSQNGKGLTGNGPSWFDVDKVAKVFTFGYGTSWTLNPKGFGEQNTKKDTAETREATNDLLLPDEEESIKKDDTIAQNPPRKSSRPAEERLQELDPTPEVSDEDRSSRDVLQHFDKSIGRFIIGLSGDLENSEFQDDDNLDTERQTSKSQRIFLRTLNVEVNRSHHRPSITSINSSTSQKSVASLHSNRSDSGAPEPKTSAAASVDGPVQQTTYLQKMQVAVYVYQPFIFVFLFSLHTPNLTMPSFYRSIHHQLGPLQGLLLKRTNPWIVADRLKDAMFSGTMDTREQHQSLPQMAKAASGVGNTIYDLIYDPVKLTIRTSIPNIPIPTTVSDQSVVKTTTVSGSWYTLGIPIGPISSTNSSSRSPSRQKGLSNNDDVAKIRAEEWSRLDALNVHQQILNSYAATHSDFRSSTISSYSAATTISNISTSGFQNATTTLGAPPASLLKDAELERTVKTNRGWWILWMRVSPSLSGRRSNSSSTSMYLADPRTDKEAFLVRRSAESSSMKASIKTGSSYLSSSPSMSGITGRWLLREQPRDRDSPRSRVSSGGFDDTSEGHAEQIAGAAAAVRGVGEGVGIDARKWIEGLLTLTQ